jgi:stage II sporulation protein D
MTRRRLLSIPLAVLLCVGPAAFASAASSRLTIRGAGWGHGVGMSQYGAKGFAEHGASYRSILGHYYTGTAVSPIGSGRVVRVLMQSTRTRTSFTGATRAGTRNLTPTSTYSVRRRSESSVWLLSPRGRRLGAFTSPLVVSGGTPITLRGAAGNGRSDGAYRGSFEFRADALGGVTTVNAVGLDDYLQGVVPAESPSSWPLEALKAQAVAARSYAITTSKAGTGFDHYPDTRSQVYGGVAVEQPSTNEAVRQTAGEVVTYQGNPVTTYFFSTSGGRTENVENTSLGREPVPWLRSVEDPYESAPRHRWGPIRMSLGSARRKLGGLVKGGFRGIDVIDRGVSPRIVTAEIVGTRGRTRVDGATLRARFGLYDTWAFFTSISSRDSDPPVATPTQAASVAATGHRIIRRPVGAIAGRILPARRGASLLVQRADDGRWVNVATTTVGRGGRYRHAVGRRADYRVVFQGDAGPRVRIR